MRLVRVLALCTVAGLLTAGVLIDRRDRPTHERPPPGVSVLPVAGGRVVTWFCPGGSGSGGMAELTIEMINGSPEPRRATVLVVPGATDAIESRSVRVDVEPGGREVFEPARHVVGARWVGAVVEVQGGDVVVEQVVAASGGGVGRSPCLTATATNWVVSSGATRLAVEGERFVVMLLNPFPDFAVADVELVADVGRDSVDGVVVPAHSVMALDVTDEVTEAESVTAFVDLVAGQLAVSWIQISDGPSVGRGASLAPGVPAASPVWHLPVAMATAEARRDLVAVTNPSTEVPVDVDLSFVADDPKVSVDPIEVTVGPRRTALVDFSRQDRLKDIGPVTVVVRSLYGDPVTASLVSLASAGSDAGAPAALFTGSTAANGADAAARRWLVPVEVTEADTQAGFGDDSSALVVFNPSTVGIAEVGVSVGGEEVRSLELGPGRRSRLPLGWLGPGRFVLEIESSAPVVAGRELVGLTSRTASLGAAVSEPVPAAGIG